MTFAQVASRLSWIKDYQRQMNRAADDTESGGV